jgi:hypothetical protein
MTNYVDVFISHKQEDTSEATRLQRRIVALGYSCYVDADDVEIGRIAQTKEKAERLRFQLRRRLIFPHSERSRESKWMPWELGFFDGRWGSVPVGLYLLRKRVQNTTKNPDRRTKDSSAKLPEIFSVQEYLKMYERVDDKNLPVFLSRRLSTTTLLNRTDADVDRLMTLVSGAMCNPLDFYRGCLQYVMGLTRGLASSTSGAALAPMFMQWEKWLGQIRRLADGQATPPGPRSTEKFWNSTLAAVRKAHDAGVQVSKA